MAWNTEGVVLVLLFVGRKKYSVFLTKEGKAH